MRGYFILAIQLYSDSNAAAIQFTRKNPNFPIEGKPHWHVEMLHFDDRNSHFDNIPEEFREAIYTIFEKYTKGYVYMRDGLESHGRKLFMEFKIVDGEQYIDEILEYDMQVSREFLQFNLTEREYVEAYSAVINKLFSEGKHKFFAAMDEKEDTSGMCGYALQLIQLTM